MKKKLFIIILLLLTLVSCTRVEILTDPYWVYLVSDFQGSALKLKFQSVLKSVNLDFSIIDVNNGIPDLSELKLPESDIYLLSPFLSSYAGELSKSKSNRLIYYFGETEDKIDNSADNMIMIKRDRGKSFFEAGVMLSRELESNLVLPVIYSVSNQILEKEALSFIKGLNSGGGNIEILTFKVDNNTTESQIRNFFDKNVLINTNYIVIFTNKWKNICYELSGRDSKNIITSDSWFNSTYSFSIHLSVEDDINGMLKKVYYNAKTEKLEDITLEGYVCR